MTASRRCLRRPPPTAAPVPLVRRLPPPLLLQALLLALLAAPVPWAVATTPNYPKIAGLNQSHVLCGYCVPPQNGHNDSVALLDEQVLAGDPAHTPQGQLTPLRSPWNPGFVMWTFPRLFAVIDLGTVYDVAAVWVSTGFSMSADFRLGVSPFADAADAYWKINTTDQPNHCPGWGWQVRWCGWNISDVLGSSPPVGAGATVAAARGFHSSGGGGGGGGHGRVGSTTAAAGGGSPATVAARYLTVRLDQPASIDEIVFYGTPRASLFPGGGSGAAASRPPVRFRSFAGTNGFVDDPLSRLDAVGVVREYHDWVWTEGEGDPGASRAPPRAALNKYSPAYSTSFDFDAFYNATAAAGIEVHQCLQGRAWFLTQGNDTERTFKPIPDTLLLKNGYYGLAAHAFQTAARYGRTKVADDLLQLAPGQSRVSGLGLLAHMETMNEPDGTFPGNRQQYMSPFELAAMHSAVYDGHEGKLGAGVGILKADPTMRVVFSGLSDVAKHSVDVAEEVLLWAERWRKDKTFPAHTLNIHRYCFANASGGVALDPEECYDDPEVQALVAWRDARAPNLEVWMSEFGWDTNQRSINRVPVYADYTADQVQGMWIARAFLVLAAQGVDRAHQFMLRDVQEGASLQFSTSGLTTSSDDTPFPWAPKASWYMVKTLVGLLGHMRFVRWQRGDAAAGTPFVAVFCAAAAGNGGDDTSEPSPLTGGVPAPAAAAVVLWLGGASGRTVQFAAPVDKEWAGMAAVTAKLVGNSTNGLQAQATVSPQSTVAVEVSEAPTLVLLGHALAPQPPTGPVPPVDPAPATVCAGLPIGLYCSPTNTSSNSSFFVCPSGEQEQCPDGELCQPGTAAGTIDCVPQAGPCDGKAPGLYCDPTAPTPAPGWPDAYVLCPEDSTLRCPAAQPHCAQSGRTAACTATTA